jgi:hypothetical protein
MSVVLNALAIGAPMLVTAVVAFVVTRNRG